MGRTLSFLITAFLLIASDTGQAGETGIPPQDVELSAFAYPYPVNFIQLQPQSQPLKMAYMDIQPKHGNGRNILLLHGKNFNGAYWESTIKALTSSGFRVIVPDQIGFGKSSKPANFQYSFHQLAENTRQLLKSLHIETVSVVGHSMGGMLATRFALMFPQLTRQLILVNPIGLEDYQRLAPYVTINQWYEKELGKSYIGIRTYQQKNYYDGHWNSEYARWAKLSASWLKAGDYNIVAWNSALTYDMIYTQPVVHEFGDIEVPTLLIIGTRDRTALGKNLVSEKRQQQMGRYDLLGKKTRDEIPGAQLVELDQVGHLPHIEAFQRYITPLVTFLETPSK